MGEKTSLHSRTLFRWARIRGALGRGRALLDGVTSVRKQSCLFWVQQSVSGGQLWSSAERDRPIVRIGRDISSWPMLFRCYHQPLTAALIADWTDQPSRNAPTAKFFGTQRISGPPTLVESAGLDKREMSTRCGLCVSACMSISFMFQSRTLLHFGLGRRGKKKEVRRR